MPRHSRCPVCYRPQRMNNDGTLRKHQRGLLTCSGSGKSASWLNTDFVPDNSSAVAAMERFDRHWEESQRLATLAGTADQYPIGSRERDGIMREVIIGLTVNDKLAEAGL